MSPSEQHLQNSVAYSERNASACVRASRLIGARPVLNCLIAIDINSLDLFSLELDSQNLKVQLGALCFPLTASITFRKEKNEIQGRFPGRQRKTPSLQVYRPTCRRVQHAMSLFLYKSTTARKTARQPIEPVALMTAAASTARQPP